MGMKIAIMQPTYLPWAGYFNLIADASSFVFLDNVEFSPRSWQQCNRIILNGEPHMLTGTVLTKDRGHQRICDVQTEETQNLAQETPRHAATGLFAQRLWHAGPGSRRISPEWRYSDAGRYEYRSHSRLLQRHGNGSELLPLFRAAG